MEGSEEGLKTKTLAVFENVVTKGKRRKKKFRTNRFSDDDSSPSESELVIDDVKGEGSKRKRSGVRIRIKKEPLSLKCLWNCCFQVFDNSELFHKHLVDHARCPRDTFECKWADCVCPTGLHSISMLIQHLTYHGYISKLVNIGYNVLNRNNLPDCVLESDYSVEVNENGYTCFWKYCNFTFNTVQDFFSHVECHAISTPSGKKKNESVVIHCQWNGCNSKFSTRYRLMEHIKIHTGEKLLACPKCFSLFSTKTTFCDHRERQLKTQLRSYQCSQCLKLFSSERILSDHMRSHINQYKCSLCDMTSTKPSMLAKHYRYRHMNARAFICNQCDKTFVDKGNLTTHLLTHQDKPFKCEQCEFGCKSKVGLRSHMIKIHGMEKQQYECQICKIMFSRGAYLTNHLMKFHKFHWPSGHSRFRYRKDSDGVFRLQTVRYESLEVTEEMIKSESMKPTKELTSVTYTLSYDEEVHSYKGTVLEQEEIGVKHIDNGESLEKMERREVGNREVIISIEDIDDKGNVIKRQEIGTSEIILSADEEG